MKPFKINTNLSVLYIILIIIIINYFGFSFLNLYWWSFYILTFLFIFFMILHKITIQDFTIRTNFILSVTFLIFFVILGLFSSLLNEANFFDSIYVILFRILPILLIIISFDFALQVDWINRVGLIDKIEKVHFFLFVVALPIGLFQKFLLKLPYDDIAGFSSNAHIYSFIILFSSIFFYLRKKNISRLILIFISIIISILADFKIGIFSFFVSFFITLIFYKKRKTRIILKYLFIGILSITILFVSLSLFREYLPGRFSLIFIIKDLSIKSLMLNLNSTFPADLELFKGYIQLYKFVFTDGFKILFGVGPGNYATNIAILKEKYYAYQYVIQYRQILDSYQIANGSLLSRNGVLINIIAEFGHLGAILYLAPFVIVSSFPVKLFRKIQDKIVNHKTIEPYVFTYVMLIIYTMIEIPIFPVLNEGINLSIIAYFGFLLIGRIQLEKDRISEIY